MASHENTHASPPHDAFTSALLTYCSLPSSYSPLLCQSVKLACFHFPVLSIWTFPSPLSSISLTSSIPQAACCIGEGRLPLKMSGLAVLLPSPCSVAPSLPAWMGHHHLVGESMQGVVNNLHFHRVVGRQVPQRTWGKSRKAPSTVFNSKVPLTSSLTSCLHCVFVPLTCDSVSKVLVTGLSQQPDQCWHSVTVLNGDLVVWIFAIWDVLQRSASCVVNL